MSARPLRILMADSERTWRGGQGQVFLLMRGLCEMGQQVTLAAPERGALFERSADLQIERIPWRGTSSPASILELRNIIAGGRFDIVHSHASRAHGAAAVANLGLRAKHLVSRRVDFDVARGPWGRWKYLHGVDAYIAISNGVRDVLVRGGVPEDIITVAESGIDLEKLARVRDPDYLRDEFKVGPGVPVIVNVAALAPHKAQDVLLDALSLLRATDKFRCFVVGEGALRADLEAKAHSLSLADVVYRIPRGCARVHPAGRCVRDELASGRAGHVDHGCTGARRPGGGHAHRRHPRDRRGRRYRAAR